MPIRRFARLSAAVFALALAAAPLAAQTASLASAALTLQSSGSTAYTAVAVAPNGDVFAVTGGVLDKYPANGAAPVAISISGGSLSISGVAIDPATGNLYIADKGDSVIDILDAGATTATSAGVTGAGTPVALAVASSTLYGVSSTAGVFSAALTGGAATIIDATSTYALDYTGVAADHSGNVFVADNANGEVSYYPSGYTTGSPTAISVGSFTGPNQLAVDAVGNLYVADTGTAGGGAGSGQLVEITSPTSGAAAVTLVPSSLSASPDSVAVDSAGRIYWTSIVTGTYALNELSFSSLNFSGVAVNSTSPTAAFTYNITVSGTLGTPLILTQGAAIADYADAGSSTCSGAKTAPTTCVVNVHFAPTAPGLRMGAVALVDGSGNRLAPTFLAGTGVGPASTFLIQDEAAAVLQGNIAPSSRNSGVAVDAAGDVYYGNNLGSTSNLMEIPAGTSTQVTVASTLSGNWIDQIAVDGAGDIYFASVASNQIYRVDGGTKAVTQLNGTTNTPLSAPHGVAVDGVGNLYIADTGNDKVYEVPVAEIGSADDYLSFTLPSNTVPYNVAFDNLGHLLYTNTYTSGESSGTVWQLDLGSGVATKVATLADSDGNATGLAVDGSGAFYVADDTAGVVKYPPGGGTAQTLDPNQPNPGAHSVAVDGFGNVYFTDINWPESLYELPLATPANPPPFAPYIDFSAVALGGQSQNLNGTQFVLGNAGNQNLVISALNFSNYFTQVPSGSADCTASTSLVFATNCTISLAFEPTYIGGVGSYSGTLNIIDNNLNTANATQTVSLMGYGSQTPTQLAFTTAVPTGEYVNGNLGSVQVSVEDVNGMAVAANTDTITVTITGPGLSTNNTATGVAASGVATVSLSGIALPQAGSYTVTATDGSTSYTAATATVTTYATSATAAASTVLTAVPGNVATLFFPSGGTLGSVAVVSATGDFTKTGTTCATGTAEATGYSCTVTYTFDPTRPGLRNGAAVAYDGSGNPLATVYLSGLGQGALAAFPGVVTAPTITGSLAFMTGLASADGVNFYSGSTSYGNLYKITAGVASVAGTGLPTGIGGASVAVDGAGNVFTLSDSNSGTSTLYEFVNKNGTLASTPVAYATGLNVGAGGNTYNLIAVDGSGNIDVALYAAGAIVQYPAGGGSPITLASGLSNFWNPAFDPSGNLYFVESGNLERIPAGGGAVTAITGPPANSINYALAFDAAGNAYTSNGSAIVEYGIAGNAASAVATYPLPTNAFPDGLVLDGSGNIFVADVRNATLDQIAVQTPTALSFSSPVTQTSAAQSNVISNVGNASLSFSTYTLATGTQFALATGAGTCSAAVLPGASCSAAVTFTPTSGQSTTPASDSIMLGYTGAPGAVPSIGLSGTGTLTTPNVAFSPTAPNVSYGTDVSVAVTLSAPITGTPAYPAPTGTVTWTIDGSGGATPTLASGATTIDLGSALTAGTHTLSVTYNADAVFAATTQTLTVTINKVTPTITYAPGNITYGGSLTGDLNASASANGGPLAGSFAYTYAAGGSGTVHAGDIPQSGTVTILATFTPTDTTDYNDATATESLTVAKVALNVTANNASFIVGGSALPALTYAITGFVNSDNSSVVNGISGSVPGLSTTATTGSAVGAYPITVDASGLSAANYTFTPVAGTLTVIQSQQGFSAVSFSAATAGTAVSHTVTFVAPPGGFAINAVVASTNGQTSTSPTPVTDFTQSSTSCSGTLAAGSTCTVTVKFLPTAPGLRTGAVTLYASGNVPLATIYLSGTGQAAQIAFPGYASTLTGAGADAAISGLASDGVNFYAASTTGVLSEIRGGTVATICSGCLPTANAASLALDGAGNLYALANTGGTAQVLEFVNENGTLATSAVPYGPTVNSGSGGALSLLAVDANGNLDIAEAGGTDILQIPAGGGTPVQIATGLSAPQALALDPSGNLYFDNGGTLSRIPAAGGAVVALSGASAEAHSHAFDAAGNLYIGNTAGAVTIYSISGSTATQQGQYTIAGATPNIGGLAYTPGGVLTAADFGDANLAQIAFNPEPTFSFAATPVGVASAPQTTTIGNLGNQPLAIATALTDSTDFTDTGNCNNATLGYGATATTCNVSVVFTPTAATVAASGLNFSDNDAFDPFQQIPINAATGLPLTLTYSAGSGQSAAVNTAFATALAVTATDTNGPVPGVVITFTGPGSGASTAATVTATTNSSGVASATATANATAGYSYYVTASAADNASTVQFNLTNAGPATHLSIPGNSPSVAGAFPTGVVVFAFDAFNHTDPTFNDPLVVTSSDPLAANPSCTMVAGNGNCYITLKTAGAQTITVTDTLHPAIAGSVSQTITAAGVNSLAFTNLPGVAQLGVPFTFTVSPLDQYGNLTTDSATVTLSSANGSFSPATLNLSSGAATSTATFTAGGAQTIAATDQTILGSAAIGVLPIAHATKTAAAAFPVNLTNPSSTAAASVVVLTQGVAGKDFQESGTDSCSGITQGQTCAVNVAFTPAAPGLRAGAVELLDSSHNVLDTVYISGLGQGAAAAFTGGAITVVDGTDFSNPRSLAMDGNGNFYVADQAKGKIYFIPAGTVAGTGTALAYTPAHTLQGIALDGAGNLYVAQNSGTTSTSTAELVKIPFVNGALNPAGAVPMGTYAPTSVATDGQGNVYILDAATYNVYQITPAGVQTTIANDSAAAGHAYDALTVGPDGAIYNLVAGEEFSKYAPGTFSHSYITSFGGEGVLNGVAVDAAGDIFVSTSGAGNLIEMAPNTGTQTTLVSSSNAIHAVALDPAGNAYILDAGAGLEKIDLADAPALAFSSAQPVGVATGALTTTVSNAGNENLGISTVTNSDSTDFTLAGTPTCAAATLAASQGATCTLSATFTPSAAGTFTATATLADNSYAGSSQAINLSGAGVLINPTVTLTPAPNTYGTASSVGVALTGVAGAPTGTISWTLDGASQTAVNLVSGAATLSLPAKAAAGLHTVVITYPGDGRYNAFSGDPSETTTVSVAQAPLTITANSFAITLAQTLPTYTSTVTGLINPDTLTSATTGTLTLSTSPTTPSGVGLYAITASGLASTNYAITYVSGSLTITSGPLNAGVGGPGSNPAATATFLFTSTTTVASVGVWEDGGTEYSSSNANNCVGTFSAGNTCTVNVAITPTTPGARNGAVVLYDGGNKVLQTIYISFTTADGAAIFPAYPAAAAVGSGFTTPAAVAFDGGGNRYVFDNATDNAYKITPAGVQTQVAHVPYSVSALALDGAGNLYLADPADGFVFLNPNENGTINTTDHTRFNVTSPTGLAVDGAGNVYVSTSGGAIMAIAPGGAISQLSSGLGSNGVAVDYEGDVYTTGPSNTGVIEIAPGGAQTTLNSTLAGITSLAVDSASDVYAATPTGVLQVPFCALSNTNSAYPCSAITFPITTTDLTVSGIAVDPQGDVVTADSTAATEYSFTSANSAYPAFGGVQVGQTLASAPLVVEDIGTGWLDFTSISAATDNFSTAGTTCAAGTHMNHGTTCNLVASFSPTATGTLQDTLAVNFASDSFDLATASFALTGVGVAIPQTISFALTPTAVYGTAPITLNATGGGSGNPVTYSILSGSNATLSGTNNDVLTITGIGTVTIAADQAASATYAAATEVTQSLTVSNGTLVLTANAATSTYGAALPTFTGTMTGQQGGDTFTESFTTTATSASPVGGYTITPSAAGANLANYNVVVNTGTLTVGHATLTITAAPASSVYGSALPTLTGSVTGGQNGDTFTATFTANATSGSAVGSYTITPSISGANIANYTVAPTTATLAITPAPLTVTANSASIVFGQPLPIYTATVAGYVNGDSASVITGSPALSTNPAMPSAIGAYPIIPNTAGMSAANYTFIPVSGTLAITSAPVPAPTTAVGATSSSFPVTFPFPFGSTIASVSVLGGTSEFASTDTSNCVGTFASGTTCTVDVTFTPANAGVQAGAVMLLDNTGQNLGTVYINGLGTGTILAFPSAPTSKTGITTLTSPTSITHDAAGDIYVLDNGKSEILEYYYTGKQQENYFPVTEALNNIAVDGAGNLYATVASANATYRIPVINGLPTFTSASQINGTIGANGLAVDASGNVYVSGSAGGSLAEVTSIGTTATVGTGVSPNAAIAVDNLGDVFTTGLSGTGAPNTGIIEISATGAQTTIAPTLTGIQSLSLDAGGDIYAATATGVVLIPAGAPSTQITLSNTSYTSIIANIIPNVTGNVWGVNGSKSLSGVSISTAPTGFTFGSVQLGQTQATTTPVTVLNVGNSAATFSSLAVSDADFSAGSTTCAAGTPLAGGATCALAPAFTPTSAPGQLTATLSMASNNIQGLPISFNLTGTGLAVLTVTANPQTRVYGAANPTATYTITGFLNGDTSSVLNGTPVLTYAATAATGVGTSAISVNVNDVSGGYYVVNGAPGVLTITPAPLAITANNATMIYGGAVPTFTGTVSGQVNGDTFAETFAATATSPVGTYAITPSVTGANLADYAVTPANGTLTVGKAALAITANNATMTYGGTLPTFTGTVSGQVNGDTFIETFATTATTSSPAGTYTITPSVSGANVGDYTVTPVNGTLTITAASQTITFAAVPAVVPGSVVTLTATATSGLAVTFKVISGSASVNGNELSVLGAGNITIEADQAGNANYLAAPPVDQTISAGAPGVSLSAASLNFGQQTVNSASAAQTIIVTNSGTAALHIGAVAASSPFAEANNCATVAAGASCSVSVVFIPNTTGAATGTLTLTDDAAGSPQTVSLTGAGTAPGISVTPAAITFGGQPLGTSSTPQSVTIANTGTAPLLIASDTASGDFSVAGGCATVPAGSSCSLNVTFTPTAIGVRSGTLTLADNSAAGTQAITLTGTGTAAGVSLTPTALAFPSTLVAAASYSEAVILTNTGTAALTGIGIAVQGDFSQTNACAATLAAGASCSINVSYNPTLAGAESGTLTVSDNLGQQPVALSGLGLAPGVNLSTTLLVFGGQPTDTFSTAQTVYLTNNGTGPLVISSVAASSGFVDSTNCAATLAAGASCSINVGFTPVTAGQLSGTVTVTDNAGDQTIATSGVGTAPGLALTPSAVAFGAQQVSIASAAQTLTLGNTGTIALTLAPRVASGDFTEADACPAILAPAASCQLSLTFTPTALGARTGSVSVTDVNAIASTIASLSGTGTLPGIAAAPALVAFGSQSVGGASAAQTVTVTNTGSAALTINAVSVTGDFNEASNCTAAPLASGANCVVSLTMTPTTAGTRTGTLYLFDNADGLHTVSLSGVGQEAGITLSSSAVAFGSAPLPTSGSGITLSGTPQTVTVTNNGTLPLAISGIGISGDFTQTNTCAASIAAGGSCTINIAFSPTGLGQRTGTLAIANNSASGIQTIALTGFGSPTGLTLSPSAFNFGGGAVGVASAPQTATLTNATGSAINDLALSASGEFSETNTCGSTLANGASCTVSVVLTPLTASGITGSIGISGTLADGGTSSFRGGARPDSIIINFIVAPSLAEVALVGSGNPAAIGLSVSSLAFTTEPVETASAAQTVTITNTGSTAALTALAVASTPDFPETTTCTATLAAGANCTVSVTFDPTAAGVRSGAITVTAGGGLSAQVALSGTATGGLLTVAPGTLAFGARPVGTLSAAQSVSISNTGTAALTLQTVAVTGGGFNLAATTCGALPATLAANATCTTSVTYTPSSAGASSGSLAVTAAGSGGSAVIALSGSGNNQGLQLSATLLTFPAQGVGLASGAQTVTLTNPGAAAVAITSIAASGDFSETNNCPASLGGGATCSVAVVFTPTASGALAGNLVIVDSGATQSAVLSGTGTNYTVGVASGSASATVDGGGTATYHLAYTPGAFTGTLSLACSGLPSGAACSFAPASLNLVAGAAASGTVLTITTTARAAVPPGIESPNAPPSAPLSPRLWLFALAGLLAMLALLLAARRLYLDEPRRRPSGRQRWAMGLLIAGALAAAGCGGVTNTPTAGGGTPAGTYTIIVTSTAGTATQTVAVTLGVN